MKYVCLAIALSSCCNGLDCGLNANIQTRSEYAQFKRDHPSYNEASKLPYSFDPEAGGWAIRQ